jgi:cell division transport system permease protein
LPRPTHKKLRRKLSYLPTFISVTLVLFLTGLLALFLVNITKLKDITKENVEFSIYFKDDAREGDIIRIQQQVQNEPFVKSVKYISKDEAIKQWQKDNGDNPAQLLGFNPFPNSIDVHFKADFVQLDSLNKLKSEFEKNINVREVSFNRYVVANMDRNMRLIGIILLSLAAVMAFISIILIYSTIRLTLYARRFIIKSMQLVGATRRFIRRPFVWRGIMLGFFSGLFAVLLLGTGLYFLLQYFTELSLLINYTETAALFIAIILLGIIITFFSTWFAVNRYLKVKLDDLF